MKKEEIGNKAIEILIEIIKLDDKMLEQKGNALDCKVFSHISEARLLLEMYYPNNQTNKQ